MKAITQDAYGDHEQLVLSEIEPPSIKDDEVLVRVRAASVDPGVWHLMTGKPHIVRLGVGLTKPKHKVRGRALAGVVEAVGAKVTRFKPGDEVFGMSRTGSWAEYSVAPEKLLARKPEGVSFESAAAAAISALVALQAVRNAGKVRPDDTVLVLGAGGGVGSYAVQFARLLGAGVTAVCSTEKLEFVRELRADHVIDYTKREIDLYGNRFDVVIDTGGNRSLRELRKAMAPSGTAVLVGGENATGRWLGGLERQLNAPFVSLVGGQKFRPQVTKENASDLEFLGELLETGRIRSPISRTYSLAEAPQAIRYVGEGHAMGKVVLSL
jgi:NADPH:quinone reductase-like Zn-dependent oxidoreductase